MHVSTGAASGDMYIRGIGSGDQQSFDQSVGTFVDDIYHGRARMGDDTFLDLDQVEVLKGPQSTFFGNNAIAGALNIITKKPTETSMPRRGCSTVPTANTPSRALSADPSPTPWPFARRPSSTAAKVGSRTSNTGDTGRRPITTPAESPSPSPPTQISTPR